MSRNTDVRLSGRCLGLLTEVVHAAYESTLEKAVERATRDGRALVAESDVRACIREALDNVAEQLQATDTPSEAQCGSSI